MSKVYQCDKCGRIFEPRVLQNGEPYIARKGKADLDLCPECYGYLMDFLKDDLVECNKEVKVYIDGEQIYPQEADNDDS